MKASFLKARRSIETRVDGDSAIFRWIVFTRWFVARSDAGFSRSSWKLVSIDRPKIDEFAGVLLVLPCCASSSSIISSVSNKEEEEVSEEE